jgi:hypothetical protein
LAEGFGLALIVAIVTSYYAYEYDLLLLMVPLLAMRARAADAFRADRFTRYLEAAGVLLLLLTPLYWFARVQLKAECLMTLPVLALGLAWARRLRAAGAATGAPVPPGVDAARGRDRSLDAPSSSVSQTAGLLRTRLACGAAWGGFVESSARLWSVATMECVRLRHGGRLRERRMKRTECG